MEKYIRLDLSYRERVMFLTMGMIPERLLPVIEVSKETIREIPKEKIIVINNGSNSPYCGDIVKPVEQDEKVSIPFFDFQDDEVKSNL
jgi:hypothetical protein